jgi:hypothetical protein
MDHQVYRAIIRAVKNGSLIEPFSIKDFRAKCPGLGEGTYKAFLYKHKIGNVNTSELFIMNSQGMFSLIRPFKYNL